MSYFRAEAWTTSPALITMTERLIISNQHLVKMAVDTRLSQIITARR